ncbi:MAG: LysE family transporter [Sphingosinicella sp.]|nr:LysE family transporter [Sphingosinicella sp.]
MFDLGAAALFLLAAIMLLGSPGPGIAALIAVGRSRGFAGGLNYFWGLQAGLAMAAGISAAGLFSVVQAWPLANVAMMSAAILYLIWLAWQIAFAPISGEPGKDQGGRAEASISATAGGGFLLGITNPKSYLAFIALFASYLIVPSNGQADMALKWSACVIVMILVDLVWLWLGVVIGRANLTPTAERALNLVMGGTILVTALLSWVQF